MMGQTMYFSLKKYGLLSLNHPWYPFISRALVKGLKYPKSLGMSNLLLISKFLVVELSLLL